MTRRPTLLLPSLLLLATACSGGDDGPPGGPTRDPGPDPAGTPVEYSEIVSLRTSGIKEDDIRDGQAGEDKSVSDESGNPYAAFLRNAEAQLGRPPSVVRPVEATLRIHADSRGVSTFDEVFESLELYVSTSASTIVFGRPARLDQSSAEVTITATTRDLEALQADLVQGSFKVGYRGPVVATPPADFDLRATIDVMFAAYE